MPLRSSVSNQSHLFLACVLRAIGKEFKGKDIEKGLAVPTCISVNNCCGHYSPLGDNTQVVNEGDLVKM